MDSAERRRTAAQIAIITRHRGPDDRQVRDLRRQLHYVKLADAIGRLGTDLTEDQRSELAAQILGADR